MSGGKSVRKYRIYQRVIKRKDIPNDPKKNHYVKKQDEYNPSEYYFHSFDDDLEYIPAYNGDMYLQSPYEGEQDSFNPLPIEPPDYRPQRFRNWREDRQKEIDYALLDKHFDNYNEHSDFHASDLDYLISEDQNRILDNTKDQEEYEAGFNPAYIEAKNKKKKAFMQQMSNHEKHELEKQERIDKVFPSDDDLWDEVGYLIANAGNEGQPSYRPANTSDIKSSNDRMVYRYINGDYGTHEGTHRFFKDQYHERFDITPYLRKSKRNMSIWHHWKKHYNNKLDKLPLQDKDAFVKMNASFFDIASRPEYDAMKYTKEQRRLKTRETVEFDMYYKSLARDYKLKQQGRIMNEAFDKRPYKWQDPTPWYIQNRKGYVPLEEPKDIPFEEMAPDENGYYIIDDLDPQASRKKPRFNDPVNDLELDAHQYGSSRYKGLYDYGKYEPLPGDDLPAVIAPDKQTKYAKNWTNISSYMSMPGADKALGTLLTNPLTLPLNQQEEIIGDPLVDFDYRTRSNKRKYDSYNTYPEDDFPQKVPKHNPLDDTLVDAIIPFEAPVGSYVFDIQKKKKAYTQNELHPFDTLYDNNMYLDKKKKYPKSPSDRYQKKLTLDERLRPQYDYGNEHSLDQGDADIRPYFPVNKKRVPRNDTLDPINSTRYSKKSTKDYWKNDQYFLSPYTPDTHYMPTSSNISSEPPYEDNFDVALPPNYLNEPLYEDNYDVALPPNYLDDPILDDNYNVPLPPNFYKKSTDLYEGEPLISKKTYNQHTRELKKLPLPTNSKYLKHYPPIQPNIDPLPPPPPPPPLQFPPLPSLPSSGNNIIKTTLKKPISNHPSKYQRDKKQTIPRPRYNFQPQVNRQPVDNRYYDNSLPYGSFERMNQYRQ